MKRLMYSLAVLIFAAAAVSGCKQEPGAGKTLTPVITFAVGEIHASIGSKDRIVKTGDKVEQNETIATGPDAFVFLQIGDEAVIRIQPNTFFTIVNMSGELRYTFLQQGKIIAKVEKLKKTDAFRVDTPVAAAAVRGTVFSVQHIDGESEVAVRSGKVATAVGGSKANLSQATIVEADYTAVTKETADAAKQTIELSKTTRSADDLTTMVQAPVVTDADQKTPEQLNELFEKFLENEKKNGETPSSDTQLEKQKQIFVNKRASLAEIKEAFKRIDEVTTFEGKVIRGVIVSRDPDIIIITPEGKKIIKKDRLRNTRVIR